MMSRITLLLSLLILRATVSAQQTMALNDPKQTFWQAREHFQQEHYSLAYPIFRSLQRSLTDADRAAARLTSDEIDFYTTACALQRQEPFAADDAAGFMARDEQDALRLKMAFYLGEYHYRNADFRNAVDTYEQTDVAQLSNRQISDMKYHQGHAYFSLNQYKLAKPLLQAVRQLPDHPNVSDAHYFYGFICYTERKMSEALEAFRKVENHPLYAQAVPFYIADILYHLGQKDKALAYAEANRQKTSGLYAHQMNQFLGHAFFEKRDFSKALSFLEASSGGPEKITRGQLYELSYAQYVTGRYAAAAEGFSQLSTGSDSLTQSAMYLLGDAYLKLGRRPEARNAFAYCASNTSIPAQREVSAFNYAKLSYELGYQDVALAELRRFNENWPKSVWGREARELLIGLLANTNNYREALSLLENMGYNSESGRRLFPKVAFGRAMELIEDGDLTGGERLIDRVLIAPENTSVAGPARFWKGEIAYRTGRNDEAIRALNAYLSKESTPLGDARPLNARYSLGYAYLRQEDYAAAQTQFAQVATGARGNSPAVVQDAHLREADCRYMRRDLAQAKNRYEQAVGFGWPGADHAQYQLAMIAGVTSASNKISILTSFPKKFPGSALIPQAAMELASTYLSEERFREAIPWLNTILKSGPQATSLKPRAHLRLGIAHFNLDNNREALDQYRMLVTDYPQAPEVEDALEAARAIYVEEGRTAEYADFLRKAGRSISQSQEDSLAWSSAENRLASGDPDATIQAIDRYLTAFPEGEFSLEAHFNRADAWQRKKDNLKALPDYEWVAEKGASRFAERAIRQAARIQYFDRKDYAAAENWFAKLKSLTNEPEPRLDAMRGLLRAQFQQQKWNEAVPNAEELLREKGIENDDRVLASMVLARAAQGGERYADAITHYKNVITRNNAAYAAEARYRIAECQFRQDDLRNAEKSALECIRKSGSYDLWITKSYILMGEVFWKQKDYFNAKATLQSVVDNTTISDLKEEASTKLRQVTEEEKKNGKLSDN
jgi:TolA-binding protein